VIKVPKIHGPKIQVPNPAARLPRFFGAADDVGALLARKAVAVIGDGSVGLTAALHLARLGVGHLILIDRGTYKSESLLTHPLPPAAVGRPKAEYTGEAVRAIAPGTRVTIHQCPFQELPLDALLVDGAPVDLVLLAVDNLAGETAVTRRCTNLGILLFQCSVGGSLLVAQLRTLTGGESGEGPCIACHYSATEWQQVSDETKHSCDGSVAEAARSLAPTRSPASLCSLAADLGVHRALRHFLGLGVPLTDQLLEYRGYTDELISTPLTRNENCRLDHQRWQILPRGDDTRTLREVLLKSGTAGPCSVQVDGAVFVVEAACGAGSWQTVGRFATPHETLGPCGHCGGTLVPSPFHTHREVVVDASMADIAVPAGRAVVVRTPSGATTMLTELLRETPKP